MGCSTCRPLFLLLFSCLVSRSSPFINQAPNIWSRPERGPAVQGRIHGGQLAKKGDYPFMASIRRHNLHFCGASIISDQIILTAAHCWRHGWPNMNVMVGFHHQHNHPNDGLQHHFEIDQWVRHEQYDINGTAGRKAYLWGFDVALIKLKLRINFTAFGRAKVAKICIPGPTVKPDVNNCEILGFGWTEKSDWYWHYFQTDGQDRDHTLRSVPVTILKPRICLKYFPIKKLDDYICSNEYKKGACAGDSGGPYICSVKGDEDTWLQFGITSFGTRSCKDAPSVYTKVSVYSEWIVETAERLLSPPTTTAKGTTP